MHCFKNLFFMTALSSCSLSLICSYESSCTRTDSQNRAYRHLEGTQLAGDSMYGKTTRTIRRQKLVFPELPPHSSDASADVQQTPVSSTVPAFPAAVAAVFDEHGKIKRGQSLLGEQVESQSNSRSSSHVDLLISTVPREQRSKSSSPRSTDGSVPDGSATAGSAVLSTQVPILLTGDFGVELVSQNCSSKGSSSGSPTSFKAPVIPVPGLVSSEILDQQSRAAHPNYIESPKSSQGEKAQFPEDDQLPGDLQLAEDVERIISQDNSRRWDTFAVHNEPVEEKTKSCWERFAQCFSCAYVDHQENA